MKNRILTGLRANGDLHLGNYIGAILPMVKAAKNLAKDDEVFMFVPNLHSFTTPVDFTQLYANTNNNLRYYLAAGLNPNQENLTFYRQSKVPAHSELTWILSCFTYFGEASRMTQFKEKSGKNSTNISVGLFIYPILMAADILLYQAPWVPVGEDQFQHLELARDLAARFNNKFEQPIFTIPKTPKQQMEFMNLDEGIRIRSLTNPQAKMSKSVDDPKGKIDLMDSPAVAAKKIMSATTDSVGEINWNWETQPGITNLLQLAYLLSGREKTEVLQDFAGASQYGELKKYVADLVQKFLTDLQARCSQITDQEIEQVFLKGEVKANEIANKTLLQVQKTLGLTL